MPKLSSYKLTTDDFDAMSEAQNFSCAICEAKAPLVIDHCHKTGKNRALLCQHCNLALGHLRDDPIIAERCAEYLRLYGK